MVNIEVKMKASPNPTPQTTGMVLCIIILYCSPYTNKYLWGEIESVYIRNPVPLFTKQHTVNFSLLRLLPQGLSFSIVRHFIVTQNLCHQFHIGCHERRKSLNTQLCMLYFHKINSEEELLKGGHLKYCQIAHYKGCTNLNWWMLDSTNSQEVFHLCKTNGILLLLKFSYVISWWVQETYD